ncbi:MAG: CoA transferase [Burkholderiales bacterium]|nr:CoA transferase [Burkholderiales bacterium]
MSTFAEYRSWLVVEVATGFGPASLAGKLLADLGCTVARIESGRGRRRTESAAPYDREIDELLSGGKDSVGIDWAHPRSAVALDVLLRSAEALVIDRAGLQRLRAAFPSQDLGSRYPGLTICACTWFGLDGPMADWSGGEEIVQAVSGIMSITGHPGAGPTRVAGAPFTHAAAMFAVTSTLADVLAKRGGARSGFLDIAVYDAAIAFQSASLPVYTLTGKPPRGIGNRHSMSAPWNSFRCADGWVIVCGGNHPNWVRLCETIGRPDLLADPKYATQEDRIAHVDALEAEIEAWTGSRPVTEVESSLAAAAIAAGSILPLPDVVTHPQFLERGLLDARSGHRRAGGVFHLDREPLDARAGASGRGAGTRRMLVDRCAASEADFDRWLADGIVIDARGYADATPV